MTSPLSTSHRLLNALQSIALLAAMAALAGFLGWTLFGQAGLWAAALGPVLALLGRGGSPDMILRLTRARPLAPEHAPGLYRLAGLLAERARLPRVPRLYRVPAPVLNAFAAGSRDNPAIALTDGLLAGLEPRELAGVLGHELSHLRANDVWVMTLAAVVGRMTSLMSLLGQLLLFILVPVSLFTGQGVPLAAILLLVFAPTISGLLQLALSRTREFDADIAAVELTGDPGGLASALAKLERQRSGWMQRMLAARAPGWLLSHPSSAERIRRLMQIEREHALA
ncbi:MAG TPA: zinc metalloprotease HtpX [Burkholderiales bacterium]|nr:zinc metalloprotease HtpX [Burkholderiales bacterium]